MRMVQVKIVTAPSAGKDMEKLDYSHTVGRNVKWYRLQNSFAVFINLNM